MSDVQQEYEAPVPKKQDALLSQGRRTARQLLDAGQGTQTVQERLMSMGLTNAEALEIIQAYQAYRQATAENPDSRFNRSFMIGLVMLLVGVIGLVFLGGNPNVTQRTYVATIALIIGGVIFMIRSRKRL